MEKDKIFRQVIISSTAISSRNTEMGIQFKQTLMSKLAKRKQMKTMKILQMIPHKKLVSCSSFCAAVECLVGDPKGPVFTLPYHRPRHDVLLAAGPSPCSTLSLVPGRCGYRPYF